MPVDHPDGLSRRSLLTGFGFAAATAAAHPVLAARSQPTPSPVPAAVPLSLVVNGRREHLAVEPRLTLLDVLREHLGLRAAKEGCGSGQCGACTVLFDGEPRYACMMLALEADGHEVTTLEGLMHGEELTPVQQAFVAEDAFQCGYCTPAQVIAAEALLRRTPNPSDEDIRQAIAGNLCRCGSYAHILKAVHRAAATTTGAAK